MTEHARVVVIGGGIIGASVAYHLTRLGWRDVRLLEQRTLTCGTTWHAAGLVGRLRGSRTASRLINYSAELYARLEAETGFETGWRRCGSLIVARTPERIIQLRRNVALSRAVGIEAHMIGAGEVRGTSRYAHRRPGRRRADPRRRKVNPADVTQALAAGARAGGARIREGVAVQRGRRARRRGDGRGDRRGPDRRRGGGQLRRHVGARARPDERRDRAAVAGRAHVHRDRARSPA